MKVDVDMPRAHKPSFVFSLLKCSPLKPYEVLQLKESQVDRKVHMHTYTYVYDVNRVTYVYDINRVTYVYDINRVTYVYDIDRVTYVYDINRVCNYRDMPICFSFMECMHRSYIFLIFVGSPC